MWNPYDSGTTVNQVGVDGGLILFDEEMVGARITLEKDSIIAPFSITCGVYGLMVHTTYASNENSALEKYEEMKGDIKRFMDKSTTEAETCEWCDWFTTKY